MHRGTPITATARGDGRKGPAAPRSAINSYGGATCGTANLDCGSRGLGIGTLPERDRLTVKVG